VVSKAQIALDQQHLEAALQALEIARSINRDDPRLQIVDSRLSKMRTELGSTVIQAAINAGNYERAAALLDEAARAKPYRRRSSLSCAATWGVGERKRKRID